MELRKEIGMPPEKGWKIKTHSYSRLWVLMHGGNTFTFYSLDWRSTTSRVLDQQLGIVRFERLLTCPPYSSHELARIYDVRTNAIVAEYRRGAKVLANP